MQSWLHEKTQLNPLHYGEGIDDALLPTGFQYRLRGVPCTAAILRIERAAIFGAMQAMSIMSS